MSSPFTSAVSENERQHISVLVASPYHSVVTNYFALSPVGLTVPGRNESDQTNVLKRLYANILWLHILSIQ